MNSLRPCQQCGQRQIGPGSRFCPSCGSAQDTSGAAVPPPAPEVGTGWHGIVDRLRQATEPRYHVVGLVGYGGMAAVYLARDPKLARPVAIKVMSPALMLDPELVDRFEREARTTAQFNHANIINIFEITEREGLHFFVMTYAPGRTLSQVLADVAEPLPIAVVKCWLGQVGAALEYAHRRDVVHRDIKPENILLDLDGNALVTDFGIAKVTDAPNLTRTGILVGTPAYMSPEQCTTGVVSGASDQYALGALAYHMLTGRPPFTGTLLSVLQAHVGEPLRPLAEVRPDCPPEVAGAIERMLGKRAEDRWPSLSAALDSMGAAQPPLDDPVRSRLQELAAHASKVTIANLPDAIVEGDAQRLEARVVDATDRVLTHRRMRWRTDDGSVAAVDPDGAIRALRAGTVRVTASCGGSSGSATVTVVPRLVDGLEVPAPGGTVTSGGALALETAAQDGGESREEHAAAWNASDPHISRVSGDDVVEAVGPGSAPITATIGGAPAGTLITMSRRALGAFTGSAVPTPEEAARAVRRGLRGAAGAFRWADRYRKLLGLGGLVLLALGSGTLLGLRRTAGNDPGSAPLTGTKRTMVSGAPTVGATPTGDSTAPALPGAASVSLGPGPGRLAAGATDSTRAGPGPASATRSDTHADEPAPPPSSSTAEATDAPAAESRQSQPTADQTAAGSAGLAFVDSAAAAEKAAGEAEIRRLVEGFIEALSARSTAEVVLVLPPGEQREAWRSLLESRAVTEFQATLGDYQVQEILQRAAQVEFSMDFSYETAGQTMNYSGLYNAALERFAGAWRLVSVRAVGER